MLNKNDPIIEKELTELLQEIIDELKSSNKNSEKIQQVLRDIVKNSQTIIDKFSTMRKMFCFALTFLALTLIYSFCMNSKLASIRSSNNDMSYKEDLLLKEIRELKANRTKEADNATQQQNNIPQQNLNQQQFHPSAPQQSNNMYPNLPTQQHNNMYPNLPTQQQQNMVYTSSDGMNNTNINATNIPLKQ